MSETNTVKLVFRKSGSKQQEELKAPTAVIDEMIANHLPLYTSPDQGKHWLPIFSDWDYYYVTGTHLPNKSPALLPAPTLRKQEKKAALKQTVVSTAVAATVSAPVPVEESTRWLSDQLPTGYASKFNFPLRCERSGLDLGKFFPSSGLAVATPYVQSWKATSFIHPIFSLSLPALVHRANACWQLEKTGTRTFPVLHKQLLFLAMLHATGCIKQEVAALPSPQIVETHFSQVIEILSWKHETASDRVQFPKLHVWYGADREDKHNVFKQIPVWLTFCEIAKEEYENKARERQKAARIKAKEMALKSIRRSMYSDVSLKRLWNWITSQVPQIVIENNPDFEMMFFAEENKIHAWTEEDFEALEDAFLKYCELGNSVSHEVSKRITQLKEWLKIYKDTFEIVTDSSKFAVYAGVTEPQIKDFKTRAEYLVTHARWKLANAKPDSNEEI